LKSFTQLSSSVTGCERGMSVMAPRRVAKNPGNRVRLRSLGDAEQLPLRF
jgi:hypothetical protein